MEQDDQDMADVRDFVQRRMPIMLHELIWACGVKTCDLAATSYPWVRNAIQRAQPDIVAGIAQQHTKAEGDAIDLEIQGRAVGRTQIGLAEMGRLSPEDSKIIEKNPVLGALRDTILQLSKEHGPLEVKPADSLTVKETLEVQKGVAEGG